MSQYVIESNVHIVHNKHYDAFQFIQIRRSSFIYIHTSVSRSPIEQIVLFRRIIEVLEVRQVIWSCRNIVNRSVSYKCELNIQKII